MIEVIPAIDIIDGRCVRLRQGEFDKVTCYETSVLDMALYYDSLGVKKLHIVDLKASVSGKISVMPIVEEICKKTNLSIQFGGGIRSFQDIKSCFNAGIQRVIIGTFGFSEDNILNEIYEDFGSKNIIIGADFKDNYIRSGGWTTKQKNTLPEFIEKAEQIGFVNFLVTDISKDGMLQGPSIDVYKKLKQQFPCINIIASGGVSKAEDIYLLEGIDIKEIIIGKALNEGLINSEEIFKRRGRC
jgi:phosphoribosylformimino-5-aminoimidazole carboxamide ribotide isomerase